MLSVKLAFGGKEKTKNNSAQFLMSFAKPTIILGINASHNASCAILIDGKIVAAYQEERFSRVKNHIGLPLKSIEYCLAKAKVSDFDISDVVVCGRVQLPFYLSISKSLDKKAEKKFIEGARIFHFLRYTVLHKLALKFPFLGRVDFALTWGIDHFVGPSIRRKIVEEISTRFKIEKGKISFSDHHATHAATAYYSSDFCLDSGNVLIFTTDGGGDELSASIWMGRGGKMKRLSATSITNSIAYMYMYTTLYLGFTPLEDEYKVMGLAPYGKSENVAGIYNKLREFILIDKKSLEFKSSVNSNLYYRYLDGIFKQKRFDNVAGAVQKVLEEKVCEWIRAACKKYRTKRIATAGGLFANVKLNQRIAELDEVKEAFFAPSPGDESNSIGACYLRFRELKANSKAVPLSNLFLGPEVNTKALDRVIRKAKRKGYVVYKPRDINAKIARLLASGEVVARMVGQAEFGTRALGNRSILADPSKLEVKDFLNMAIKSRDFWMPFAPAVLEEEAGKYLKNPKQLKSSFMMVTFNTIEKWRRDLIAAIHPFDKTARAQIVVKQQNPDFWDLIYKFDKLAGRGVILNTSFNLHGEPIVLTPSDALKTFENSNLKYLQIEGYLMQKLSKI